MSKKTSKPNDSALAVVSLWNRTTKITRSIDIALGTLHGIGFTEYMILRNLQDAPNTLMRRIDLAQAVGLSASGVTRIVGPMEKVGLVAKESSPRDARVSLVKLTKAGERIFNESSETFVKMSEQAVATISKSELAGLTKTENQLGR